MVTTQTGFTVVRENLEKGLFFGKKSGKTWKSQGKLKKTPQKSEKSQGKNLIGVPSSP